MASSLRTLHELLRTAEVRPLRASGPDPEIVGVNLDSRQTGKGDLFFAMPGLELRGDDFVPEAIARGASAVVSSSPRPAGIDPAVAWVQVEETRRASALISREFFGRPDEDLYLVGITGTNGKTTVSYLVEAIARVAGRNPGRVGTVGYAFGGMERPAARTTPDATELYGLLAAMRDAGVDLVAIEVSSHALALSRVEGARFRVGALLNLGRDHLDFHGTPEAYFQAKASLIERLRPEDSAVLPADDPAGEILASRTRARQVTFGRSSGAGVRLREERRTPLGSSVLLETASGTLRVQTALPGRHNLLNVAAAAACALAAGCPPESIPAGIATLDRVPGRFEAVDRGQPFTVLIDYAHTPEGLRGLLESVRELLDGRLILVFGCGGERDRGKRPLMGRVAAERADLVFLTSDNPRREDPLSILREVEQGFVTVAGARGQCRVVPDRAEAIAAAISSARPGDAVIVAGKGHETTQTTGDRVLPFDDRKAAEEALSAIGFTGGCRAGA